MIDPAAVEHLAYSILHGTFDPKSPGGCSCPICTVIRDKMADLLQEEAARFYNEHYPPPGGFL